jgi:hypothetical protein
MTLEFLTNDVVVCPYLPPSNWYFLTVEKNVSGRKNPTTAGKKEESGRLQRQPEQYLESMIVKN